MNKQAPVSTSSSNNNSKGQVADHVAGPKDNSTEAEELVMEAVCSRATTTSKGSRPGTTENQQVSTQTSQQHTSNGEKLKTASASDNTGRSGSAQTDDEMDHIKEEERLTQLRPAVMLALKNSFTQTDDHATKECHHHHHHHRLNHTRSEAPAKKAMGDNGDSHQVSPTRNDAHIRKYKSTGDKSVSPKNVHLHSSPNNAVDNDDNGDQKARGKATTKDVENRQQHQVNHACNQAPSTKKATGDNQISPTRSNARTRKYKGTSDRRAHSPTTKPSQQPRYTQKDNDNGKLLEEIKKQERITQLNPAYTLAFRNSETTTQADAADRIAKEMDKNDIDATTLTTTSTTDHTKNPGVVDSSQTSAANVRPISAVEGIPDGKTQAMTNGDRQQQQPESALSSSNDGDELDLLKLAATRSRATADVSDLPTSSSTKGVPAFAENWTEANNNNNNEEEDSQRYSQNSKKRTTGLVQPGAYGAAPGTCPSRLQSLRFSRLTEPSHDIKETTSQELLRDSKASSWYDSKQSNLSITLPEHDQEDQSTNGALVEARPVFDDSLANIEVESVAEPDHRLSEEELAVKEQEFWIRCSAYFAAICLVVITVVVFALYFADVIYPDDPLLVTKSPTMMPSESPSLAPTFNPHHLDLPDYTLQAMQDDPQSPQALAYTWIQEDSLFDSISPFRQMQRFALATVFYATNGQDWTVNKNWLNYSVHECDWHTKGEDLEENSTRQLCDSEGRYLELLLTKNRMKGSLPPELALLTHLHYLDVASNEITGTIPSEIGSMTFLKEFLCDVNEMSGVIPSEFGLLSNLDHLYVHTNSKIWGTLPTELGMLTNMKSLQWLNTETSGTIPTELGMLTKMTSLYLNANRLTGTVPTELGLLTGLSYVFNLGLNLFTGTMPSELGLFSNLKFFYLGGNDFAGKIPTEIGTMTSLAHFFVNVNNLSGTLPSEIGLLSNMEVILLNENYFSGSIPSELGTMTSLVELALETTLLSGSVPWELGNLATAGSLNMLKVNNTLVTGEIPSDLCVIPELHFDCSASLCGCYCVCLET